MPTAEAINTTVDQWFAEKIACGVIGQVTPAYNQAFHARDDLKARIATLFPGAQPALEPQPETAADAAPPKE